MITSASTLHRLRNDLAGLEKKRSDEQKNLAKLEKDIASLLKASTRSQSSTIKHSQLASKREQQARVGSKIADLSKQISSKAFRLERAVASNADEAEKAIKRQQIQARRRQQTEINHVLDISHEVEIQSDSDMDMQRYDIFNPQLLPKHITILYLATNPVESQNLDLAEEVRAIQQAIRQGEYRDAIRFETRWAVRPEDIIPYLNDIQPNIIHISGHGDAESIYAQNSDKLTAVISVDAFLKLVQAISHKPKMIIFSTCKSEGFAQAVLPYVPIAIGIRSDISDKTSLCFFRQFYSTLASNKSVQEAFNQAEAAILLAGLDVDQTPMLFVREDLDANEIILVQPY